jgi:phage protein D
MTTAAMVVAMVPLLIAKGAGAASRFDIGVVIAAGMTIGTIFTLFVTPAVYTFLAKDYQKARAREAEHATSASEAAPATAEADVPTKAAGQETAAADLATVASEGQREEGHSAEVLAFSSAAAAASTEKDKGRKGGRKPPKRKPLNPAAE